MEIARTDHGHFIAGGVSPNPGGRPAALKHVIALAREHTESAILELRRLMLAGESDYVRLAACQTLLDRNYSPPPRKIVLDAVTGASIHGFG